MEHVGDEQSSGELLRELLREVKLVARPEEPQALLPPEHRGLVLLVQDPRRPAALVLRARGARRVGGGRRGPGRAGGEGVRASGSADDGEGSCAAASARGGARAVGRAPGRTGRGAGKGAASGRGTAGRRRR